MQALFHFYGFRVAQLARGCKRCAAILGVAVGVCMTRDAAHHAPMGFSARKKCRVFVDGRGLGAYVVGHELYFRDSVAALVDCLCWPSVPWGVGVFDLGAGFDIHGWLDASDVYSAGLVHHFPSRDGAVWP